MSGTASHSLVTGGFNNRAYSCVGILRTRCNSVIRSVKKFIGCFKLIIVLASSLLRSGPFNMSKLSLLIIIIIIIVCMSSHRRKIEPKTRRWQGLKNLSHLCVNHYSRSNGKTNGYHVAYKLIIMHL